MSTNKIVIYISVIACILLIACPTLYKVIKQNHSHLISVSEKKIIEAAERCFYEGKCSETKIFLKDLYKNGYLSKKLVNPVTKEVYNDNDYVVITKKDSSFFEA